MPTRTYPRTGGTVAACHPEHLARLLDTALGRTDTVVTVDPTTIAVTHAALVAADDAAITGVIDGYVLDASFFASVEAKNLRGKVAVLRGWAAEGEAVFFPGGTWGSLTQDQKNAVLRVMGERLTRFFSNFADFLTVQGFDNGG